MKLQLNLSTHPIENKRPFLAGATLAGVLGVVALALLSSAAYHSWLANRNLHLQIAQYQDDIRINQGKQQSLEDFFGTSDAHKIFDRAAFLNSLIDQRSFPWTKVFMDLEQTLPAGVRVVSISPRLQNGRAQIDLIVGAMSDEGKIEFLRTLEHSKAFSDVQIKGEAHPTEANSPDRVRMQLSVWYTKL